MQQKTIFFSVLALLIYLIWFYIFVGIFHRPPEVTVRVDQNLYYHFSTVYVNMTRFAQANCLFYIYIFFFVYLQDNSVYLGGR